MHWDRLLRQLILRLEVHLVRLRTLSQIRLRNLSGHWHRRLCLVLEIIDRHLLALLWQCWHLRLRLVTPVLVSSACLGLDRCLHHVLRLVLFAELVKVVVILITLFLLV